MSRSPRQRPSTPTLDFPPLYIDNQALNIYINNKMNIYGIYSKLNQFLNEEEGTNSQPAPSKIDEFTQAASKKINDLKSAFDPKPPQQPQREARSTHQQQQPTPSFLSKLEEKWDNFRQKSKSPIASRQQSEVALNLQESEKRRKIFEPVSSVNLGDRKRALIFERHAEPSPKKINRRLATQSSIETYQEKMEESFSINQLVKETGSVAIEDMYYKEDNEVEILSTLISKLGRKPNTEKLAVLLESLTKKKNTVIKSIMKETNANQNLLQQGLVMQDSLTFRVNQCCARVLRLRQTIKLLKQAHCVKGLQVQRKLQQKAAFEQQLLAVQQFKQRYQDTFDLIEQLNYEGEKLYDCWPLMKLIAKKDLVWQMSKDSKHMFSKYPCFNDIRGYLEGLFQQLLQTAYIFFTSNIISTFLNMGQSNAHKILDKMCDYLVHYELVNKSVEFSKQIKSSIQAQFRSILRQNMSEKVQPAKFRLRKHLKFESLQSCNIYLQAFLISVYKCAYSLNQITAAFNQLLANPNQPKNKQSVLRKLGFQYQFEKNQFWTYIQQKFVKTLRKTQLENSIVYYDWEFFEQVVVRIIQIGEELSNLKSDVILNGLANSLRLLPQGISTGISKCLSLQKGMGNIKTVYKFNQRIEFFPRLEKFIQNKRIDLRSTYLNQLLETKQLLSFMSEQLPPQTSNVQQTYTKKEEFFFIVSQFQELQLLGQYVPLLQADCFLQLIQCFEFYSFIIIKFDLKDQIAEINRSLENIETIDFATLVKTHSWICQHGQYRQLMQMIIKQMDRERSLDLHVSVKYQSNCLREIVENLTLCYEIQEYAQTQYSGAIQSDKEFFGQMFAQMKNCLTQLKGMWLFIQGQRDVLQHTSFAQIQSYQLLYAFNQLTHQIEKSNQVLNTRIQSTEIGQIYFRAFSLELVKQINLLVNKQNKLQILAELQKFQKQVSVSYNTDFLKQYLGLLDVKSQGKCLEAMLQAKLVPLQIQMELLEKEFTIDQSSRKMIHKDYVQYIEDY